MKFGLAFYLDIQVEDYNKELILIETKLEEFFKEKEFGNSVKRIIISTTIFSTASLEFHKPFRPKYILGPKYEKDLFNNEYIIEKYFSFEVRMNVNDFLNNDNKMKYVAVNLLKGVRSVKLPKKITDFDRDKFYRDMEQFFINENILSQDEIDQIE